MNLIQYAIAILRSKKWFNKVSLNRHTDCHHTLQFIILNQYLLTWLLYGSVPMPNLTTIHHKRLFTFFERFTSKKVSDAMEMPPCHSSSFACAFRINYLAVYSTFQIARLWKKEMQIGLLNTFLCLLDYDLFLSNCV